MKKYKKLIKLFAIGAACVLFVIIVCHYIVVVNASGKTYDNVEEIPHNKVGLLLATSPITPGGAHNYYFENRIKAADELYKVGKIDFIIASGGDYTRSQKNGCDEPAAIRDSLIARGIPDERIILDYEGLRTLNSIAKAKQVYDLDSLTLISQKYHNERAIYIANRYCIQAVGYNAKPSPICRNRIKNTLREFLARPKMFLDILTGNNPDIKKDTISIPSVYELCYDDMGLPRYLNSVKGHKEEQTIIGNFTGEGIDTIYIDYEFDKNRLSNAQRKKYGFGLVGGGNAEDEDLCYAVSNNPELPPVELFCPNGLVFEGDVDGDGKDEWGYLYEWMTSQWRQYRIYTFDTNSGTWKHLYYGDLLDTPEYVRASGKEIVGKGPCKGLIKINWGAYDGIVYDTIVPPTFTSISKDAW